MVTNDNNPSALALLYRLAHEVFGDVNAPGFEEFSSLIGEAQIEARHDAARRIREDAERMLAASEAYQEAFKEELQSEADIRGPGRLLPTTLGTTAQQMYAEIERQVMALCGGEEARPLLGLIIRMAKRYTYEVSQVPAVLTPPVVMQTGGKMH